MLIEKDASCLLIVDVQEKLTPFIHRSEAVVKNIAWLLQVAAQLHVPHLFSEQYSKGLGHTISELKQLAPKATVKEKTEFSCAVNNDCIEAITALQRPQIVVAGIEAHVCILQTSIGLAQRGLQVFVVADAIGSRDPNDYELAVARMRHHANIHIVSHEMVLFEWVHRSDIPQFKALSKEFLQKKI